MAEKAMLTCDAVVFTIKNNQLLVLLIKRGNEPFKGKYALPGGIVDEGEEVDNAANRELYEETGIVTDLFFNSVYSSVKRDPRKRSVSFAYIGLVTPATNLCPGDDAKDAKWFFVNELPELGFDHEKIIIDAKDRLRSEIMSSNIIKDWMPAQFSLTQLKKRYEAILEESIELGQLQSWVEKCGLFIKKGDAYTFTTTEFEKSKLLFGIHL